MAEHPMKILVVFGFLLTPITLASFDYFQFVQTWPSSFCRANACARSPLPNNFTVHGLWPANFTLTQTCYAEKYIPFTNPTLIDRLDESWPDLTRSSVKTKKKQIFWRHEWLKHGGCSGNLYTQTDYFKLGMDLKDRYNLLDILSSNAVTPGGKVGVAYVRKVISKHFGKQAKVKCSWSSGQPHLLEIVLCTDPTGKNVINCPGTTDFPQSCNGYKNAWFPTP